MERPKAGSRLWNVGGFRPQRQGLRGAKRGGERHTQRSRDQRKNEQTGGQRQEPGEGPGLVICTHSSPKRHPPSPETSLCGLGCCRAQPDAGSLAARGPGGPSAPGHQPWGSGSRQGVGGGLGRGPRGGAGEGGPDAQGELLRTLLGNRACGREGIPGLGKWARERDGAGSEDGDDGFRQGTRGHRASLLLQRGGWSVWAVRMQLGWP